MQISVLIREETSREVFIPVNSITTRLYAFEIPVGCLPRTLGGFDSCYDTMKENIALSRGPQCPHLGNSQVAEPHGCQASPSDDIFGYTVMYFFFSS